MTDSFDPVSFPLEIAQTLVNFIKETMTEVKPMAMFMTIMSQLGWFTGC